MMMWNCWMKWSLDKRDTQIRFAFLHGSFIDELPCRDIDIGVYFDPQLALETMFDLTLELSVELTSLLHVPVDMHALNQAGNGFCYHVSRGILLVSRDDEETYDFIEKTWLVYLDFQPLARQILNDLL
ncbi:predicted nucleotidyltransferases [Pelotomaculum thermopropionicum SI]|uniref:Predicted nucleotidyltransferases n=1 Tax=Pelotomaculum thermopropionicum (strain DSM 13744 / JCM 10971 / SI) TaxID=370438 RepID=A5D0D8_PELTS|nr:predicted nucleotidyltransferases [Pelotomaculum thermopropionicum SI]